MGFTVAGICNAKDRIQVGDYVIEETGDLRSESFKVGRVIIKSWYVFVVEELGTSVPGVRTSYQYLDLLYGCRLHKVTEEQALRAAKYFAACHRLY